MKESMPTLVKDQKMPLSERADMKDSPVTQEEIDAAMLALGDDAGEIPQAEKIGDDETAEVTEKEMADAVEALGDFENENMETESMANDVETENSMEASEETDAEKIARIRAEMDNIPPSANETKKGYGGNEKGPRIIGWAEIKYKKCEKCRGSGRRFLFLNCPACKGRGQVEDTQDFYPGKVIGQK